MLTLFTLLLTLISEWVVTFSTGLFDYGAKSSEVRLKVEAMQPSYVVRALKAGYVRQMAIFLG